MRARRRITTVAPSVGPLGIAGCVLWLRADLGVTKDGSDKVSQWDDQSGAGLLAAVTAAGAARPTWSAAAIGGRPAVQGFGAEYLQGAYSAALAQPSTVFVVLRPDSLAPATSFFFASSTLVNRNSALYTSGTALGIYAGSSVQYALTVSAGSPLVFAAIFANAASGIRKNGTASGALSPGAASTDGVTLFARGDAASFATATIAEVIVYGGSLSAGELSRIEQYLGARYGITVA